MKIFLSHSSKNKPLIREIKSYLPEHIKLWVDEKDLLIGDDLETTIKDAIESDSDYVIIFIDSFTSNSPWILKELSWAIEREIEIGRTFILPVILDKSALDNESLKQFSKRKYIPCYDFAESSIRSLANNIISELFAWLSRDINKRPLNIKNDASIKVLNDADDFTAQVADQIRLIVYPYRKEHPLEVEELFKITQQKQNFTKLSFSQFLKLLERLQKLGYLSGIICDGFNIFVEEEHFAWKTAVFNSSKKRLAKKAVSLIQSNYVIALDGGSTTLEVAKQIGLGLKMKAWNNLKIVTNSLAAANELLNISAEMGWDDESSFMQVFITGGRIRPNTLAIVNDSLEFKTKLNDDFKNMLLLFKKADIGFIGCNGIHKDFGFSTHNNVELYTKQDILTYSKRKIIITDPSKFDIKEECVFATFEDEIDIITTAEGFEDVVECYNKILESKTSNLIIA